MTFRSYLDGTLIRSDTLWQLLILAIRQINVLRRIPLWLKRGEARSKSELGLRLSFDSALLPYDERLFSTSR